jgi:hypothetical protein
MGAFWAGILFLVAFTASGGAGGFFLVAIEAEGMAIISAHRCELLFHFGAMTDGTFHDSAVAGVAESDIAVFGLESNSFGGGNRNGNSEGNQQGSNRKPFHAFLLSEKNGKIYSVI